jgi:23S rRNA (cytosine1962-C5)-methyltransferase
VYRSDLAGEPTLAPGAVVSVADPRENLIGTAFYSTSSQIALRLISSGAVENIAELVRERIVSAVAGRKLVVQDSDSWRVIFSEADQLPGIIADKYNDIVTVQFLTQATDQAWFRETALEVIQEQVQPSLIIERVEERIRELEQLPGKKSEVVWSKAGAKPNDGSNGAPAKSDQRCTSVFTMNGVRFQFNGLAGQKTGAFLDQRENYAAAAQYAHGDAIDVFCYQGGFALHMARACDRVTAVDASREALETAEQNEALNRSANRSEIDWVEANAFDLLKDYSGAGKKYDTIVLDPPAFAKTKKDLGAALRGYKEINLRAMKMLRPGGVLVTCSCSHHVSESDFMDMLREASGDARRVLRVVEKRGQAKDHPVLLGVPETAYLKCVILQG